MPQLIKDEDLPLRYKKVSELAEVIGNDVHNQLSKYILEEFNKNPIFGELGCSDIMSFIQKVSSIIFLKMLFFTVDIANKFPDTEHNAAELYEEVVKGMRYVAGFKKIDEKEYINGIKRINI